MLFQRFLDAKRSLVVAIEQYRAAYQYWALRESPVTATVGDSVSVFDDGLAQLAKIQIDEADALDSFKPNKPAPFNESFLITDARALEQLRTKRTATWTIDLDQKKLASLDRVRVITVRVWLIGVTPPSAEDTIEVVITNSGVYADRINRSGKPTEKFLFSAEPLTTAFRYSLVSGSGTKVKHPDITGWVKTDGRRSSKTLGRGRGCGNDVLPGERRLRRRPAPAGDLQGRRVRIHRGDGGIGQAGIRRPPPRARGEGARAQRRRLRLHRRGWTDVQRQGCRRSRGDERRRRPLLGVHPPAQPISREERPVWAGMYRDDS